jgi:hypothetical protein
MKLLFFLFTFSLTNLISHAQEIFHVYECGISTYSDAFDKWIYDTARPVHLTFQLQQRVLIVDDRKRSTYVLGESFQTDWTEDLGALGWYAVDEDGKKCAVKLIFHRTGNIRVQINVVYGHSGFYYNGTLENK